MTQQSHFEPDATTRSRAHAVRGWGLRQGDAARQCKAVEMAWERLRGAIPETPTRTLMRCRSGALSGGTEFDDATGW
eukprot:1987886-Pyramimonas_sp.AAC.1